MADVIYRMNQLPPLKIEVKLGARVRWRLWIARRLVELAAWVLEARETNVEEVDPC